MFNRVDNKETLIGTVIRQTDYNTNTLADEGRINKSRTQRGILSGPKKSAKVLDVITFDGKYSG